MFRQPAFAGSALQGLHDELVAYMTLFCSPEELLALAQVNSVFYVFAREEPLWMLHCLRLHGGDFTFFRSWRLTTFFPRVDTVPKHFPVEFPTLHVRDFGSDFLYRRWCRSHMSLDQFLPPTDALARRIHRFNVEDLSYRDFFEQYARVPFILHNAIGKWNASSQWSVPQLATRFPDARHRLTHNLDTASDKATQMTFADYRQYLAHQHDETPLYIFDPRFGEKMPELLNDYKVEDLKVFQEDLVQQVSQSFGDPVTNEIEDKIPRPMRSDFRWIVIGPQRSGAPWHTDPARTSAWNALVQGRKRWALYPPGTPPPGISVGKNAAGRNHALDMTSLAWYLHVYPTLPPHERPLEVVQEPGDVIYVPSGWWHLVLNLDETVAVTQNFVDSHNLVMFVNDLLDDQQDEALQIFQHAYSKEKLNRPEIVDVCRVLQIPRRLGFLSGEMYLTTFRDLKLWRPRIKKILTRHKLVRGTSPAVRNLTARVNPAFAVDDTLLVKFFSELNQDWGEFDFTTFLTPQFDLESAVSPSKKRKTSIVPAHALKKAMTLRFAMEESFRIERTTYQMLIRAEDAVLRSMVPTFHVAGHLLDVSQVDENDEDDESDGGFWRWPYVVMEFKRGLVGISRLVKHGGGASMESWQRLSAWVNTEFVPRLHAVEIDDGVVGLHGHSKKHWDWYEHYLLRQRKRALAFHLKEDAMPPQLMNVLEQFLPAATPEAMSTLLPAAGSAARAKPVLLHGDLTDENVLGTASSVPRDDTSPENANDTDAKALTSWLKSIGCASVVDKLVRDAQLTKRALSLLSDNHLRQLGVPPGLTLAIRAALDQEQQLGSHQPWLARTDASDSDSDEEDEDEDDDINEFLSSPAQLESARTSRLKQFYGEVEWTPSQVIDFADAKTGDPLYDLVAIFFSALHCDPELWRVAIATPYWQNYLAQQQTALQCDAKTTGRLVRERFLRLTLLHPSRSIKSLFHFFPQAVPLYAWDHVADVVFGDLFVPSSN